MKVSVLLQRSELGWTCAQTESCGSSAGWVLPRSSRLGTPKRLPGEGGAGLGLEGGAEAVWARMPNKTRYEIRTVQKRGVCVRPALDDADIERFHELMMETGERAGFLVRSLAYYRNVLREFQTRGQAELFLAELNGHVAAGVMAFAYGDEGIYMYAASSNQHKREKPNDLLQWKAIEWCIEKGCTRYDLWGIPEQAAAGGDEHEGAEGLWGVYRFKQRFADRTVRYIGAYDYPYQTSPLPPLHRRAVRVAGKSVCSTAAICESTALTPVRARVMAAPRSWPPIPQSSFSCHRRYTYTSRRSRRGLYPYLHPLYLLWAHFRKNEEA